MRKLVRRELGDFLTRGFWEHLDQCLDLLRYLGGHGHRAFNWSCTASSCRRYFTSLNLRQSYVDSRKTVQFSSLNSMMNIRTLTLSPLFAEFKGQKMHQKHGKQMQKKNHKICTNSQGERRHPSNPVEFHVLTCSHHRPQGLQRGLFPGHPSHGGFKVDNE